MRVAVRSNCSGRALLPAPTAGVAGFVDAPTGWRERTLEILARDRCARAVAWRCAGAVGQQSEVARVSAACGCRERKRLADIVAAHLADDERMRYTRRKCHAVLAGGRVSEDRIRVPVGADVDTCI